MGKWERENESKRLERLATCWIQAKGDPKLRKKKNKVRRKDRAKIKAAHELIAQGLPWLHLFKD